jgi:hypothetical protein
VAATKPRAVVARKLGPPDAAPWPLARDPRRALARHLRPSRLEPSTPAAGTPLLARPLLAPARPLLPSTLSSLPGAALPRPRLLCGSCTGRPHAQPLSERSSVRSGFADRVGAPLRSAQSPTITPRLVRRNRRFVIGPRARADGQPPGWGRVGCAGTGVAVSHTLGRRDKIYCFRGCASSPRVHDSQQILEAGHGRLPWKPAR